MTTMDVLSPAAQALAAEAAFDAERDALALRARRTRLMNRASLALPLLGGAIGAWLWGRGFRYRSAGMATFGAAIGLGVVRWQLQRFVTESTAYEVVGTLGDIQLRKYPEQVWAETSVEHASWNEALHEGFRRLAGYLFGDNNEAERLSMTAPVLSFPLDGERSEQLSMTAPVLADEGDSATAQERTIAFVMPADRDLDTLPAPKDLRVCLRAVPERLVAALRFRGDYASGVPAEKREELLRRLREAGIGTRGEARFAGYDPPTTWSALRRNELLIDLAISS